MSSFWEIQGETGKTLDATKYAPAALGCSGLGVVFPALATDTLSWRVTLAGLAPALTDILPQAGQKVILWRDGVRFFTGTALQPAQSGRQITVTVLGPWDWLARTPVKSLVGGWDGAAKNRAKVYFYEQGIHESLGDLFDAAIAEGAPFAKGTIATCLTVPAMTLQSDSYAGAISELCRMVPDGMLWFDYSTATPQVNFTRRAGASTRTVDAEQLDAESWEFTPRPEQQQSRIVVSYADRAANGKTIYGEQAYPVSATGISADKTQMFTISGPEIGETVPNDYLDSYNPYPLAPTTGNLQTRAFIDLAIGAVVNPTKNDAVALGNSTVIQGRLPTKSDSLGTIHTTDPIRFMKDDGTLASTSGKYWSNNTSAEPPDWYPYTAEKVTVKGEVYFQWFEYQYKSDGTVQANGALPAWFKAEEWTAYGPYYLTNYDPDGQRMWLYTRKWEMETWLLPNNTATLYAPPDYEFIQPSTNMAENMHGMVSWLPWDGRFAITEAEAGGTRYRGCKVNVTNALAALTSAGALVSQEECDIDAGTTRVTLGAPAKFDFAAFTDKFSQRPQNNVIIL